MRLIIWLTPLALAACAAPAPQSAATAAAQTTNAPFEVSMDPGAIRCQSLSNPDALVAATDWAMGQARAGVLSGRSAVLPDGATLSNNLATYCGVNEQDIVRTAAANIGL